MRKCEKCNGPGPALWAASGPDQGRYCCVKCHPTPHDEFFKRSHPERPSQAPEMSPAEERAEKSSKALEWIEHNVIESMIQTPNGYMNLGGIALVARALSSQVPETKFEPDWCSPPWETIEEMLVGWGWAEYYFLAEMGRDMDWLAKLKKGDVALTTEDAEKLAALLDVPAEFWTNRQRQYEETKERLARAISSGYLPLSECRCAQPRPIPLERAIVLKYSRSLLPGECETCGKLVGEERRLPKLTKEQIRAVLDEHEVKHTDVCRGENPKGKGGRPDTLFGGYLCSCDWMARVRALVRL
jgi:plasmid maintenance system antidote protein VapI